MLLLFSCTDKGKNGGTDTVYADYTISAEEESENATCLFRFQTRADGATGVLEPHAAVLSDGAVVPADSAGHSGAYYEAQRPVSQFAGSHTILLKMRKAKCTKRSSPFNPFQ